MYVQAQLSICMTTRYLHLRVYNMYVYIVMKMYTYIYMYTSYMYTAIYNVYMCM